VLVVLGALVAAAVVDRRPGPAAPAPPDDLARVAPSGASADALGSTWYCAAGSSDPDGPVGHTVVVVNPTDREVQGTLTAYPGSAEPVPRPLTVPAGSTLRVELADLVVAPAVAALVEMEAGEVVVAHELAGPAGADAGPCASHPSTTWYLAWGDTSRDARLLIALFNPFPDDAVLDLAFTTPEGTRTPRAFEGLVVPGGSVIVADVGAEVTRRPQVATTIVARRGRVVAERIQVFDEPDALPLAPIPEVPGADESDTGEDPDEDGGDAADDAPADDELPDGEGRRGLAVDLAVPTPQETWVLPATRVTADRQERIIIHNPDSRSAEVDVELLPVDAAEIGGIEPFELTVRAGETAVLDLGAEARVLDAALDRPLVATAVVRSLNGVGVVVERVTYVAPESDGPGSAASTGSALEARSWVLAPGAPTSGAASRLTLVNPSADTIVIVRLELLGPAGRRPLPGQGEVELDPAAQVELDLGTLVDVADLAQGAVLVSADAVVIVEAVGRSTDPADRVAGPAIPLADGLARPTAFAIG